MNTEENKNIAGKQSISETTIVTKVDVFENGDLKKESVTVKTITGQSRRIFGWGWTISVICLVFIVVGAIIFSVMRVPRSIVIQGGEPKHNAVGGATTQNSAVAVKALDKTLYDTKLKELANVPIISIKSPSSTPSSTIMTTTTAASAWPVKTVYPNAGAMLPFDRIVAYYGNFYSTQMGVLGEYPEDQMLAMLASTTAMWQAADPTTPTIPAIDYIAVTAQGSPQWDGKYRLRMPPSQIQKAIALAAKVNGIVVLDVQVGLSDVQTEVPLLAAYLKLPQVHLALDPEFSMKTGAKPGTVIGTMDAADINFAANYLANLVRENNLPPKLLIVHRFTEPMVTNYRNITPLPEVQVIMDMDGFGPPAQKISTYRSFIIPEPVQFTGFKLFYKNDIREPGSHLLTPVELLKLSPRPSFIQYQ